MRQRPVADELLTVSATANTISSPLHGSLGELSESVSLTDCSQPAAKSARVIQTAVRQRHHT